MEFGERKRRRKSQSFKLVTDEDVQPSAKHSSEEPREDDVWLGDDGMEIKKQITGMMRLLTDKTGRVYHRVDGERDRSPPEIRPTTRLQLVPRNKTLDNCSATEQAESSHISNATLSDATQYGSRVADFKSKRTRKVAPCDANCCTCNCKGTLTSILHELRDMRRLMQTQKEAQEPKARLCHTSFSSGLCTRRRRRPLFKATVGRMSCPEVAPISTVEASPLHGSTAEFVSDNVAAVSEVSAPTANVDPANSHKSPLQQLTEPQTTGVMQSTDVRLAENYEVFISKSQLDSILVNYTRSGSLLFRKLVCAFFNDDTLANSLPNGKRKRGLNDNRKGLDQNIVGAIKVFTEKYCTEHKIDKLPGPRDWVQILQDQIKLARRRLKRDAAGTEEPKNGATTSVNKKPRSKDFRGKTPT